MADYWKINRTVLRLNGPAANHEFTFTERTIHRPTQLMDITSKYLLYIGWPWNVHLLICSSFMGLCISSTHSSTWIFLLFFRPRRYVFLSVSLCWKINTTALKLNGPAANHESTFTDRTIPQVHTTDRYHFHPYRHSAAQFCNCLIFSRSIVCK